MIPTTAGRRERNGEYGPCEERGLRFREEWKRRKVRFRMKRSVLVIVLAAAVFASAVGVYWCFFRDSDERRIRRTLEELCEIGSKSSGENAALGALKANRADHVFAPVCRFDFAHQAVDGALTPTETGARILRLQGMFDRIRLSFSELEIAVKGDKADAAFSGAFKGRLKYGDAREVDEIREIEAELARQPDGRWKFTRMSIRQVLEK